MDDSGGEAIDPQVVDPRLVECFSALRRPQTQRDLEHQPEFVSPVAERYGLLPVEVRKIPLSSTATLWITPGSKGAALSMQRKPVRGRASWFAEAESICSRGLWGLLESPDGRRSLCGIVPDGNSHVRLQLRAGEARSLPTKEGAVVVDDIEPIRVIGFVDAYGSQQQHPC
jgi:hypothetical protein